MIVIRTWSVLLIVIQVRERVKSSLVLEIKKRNENKKNDLDIL